MKMVKNPDSRFSPVEKHVNQTFQALQASGASVMIIHNDSIAAEKYWGRQSHASDSRVVQEDSQFHVASV